MNNLQKISYLKEGLVMIDNECNKKNLDIIFFAQLHVSKKIIIKKITKLLFDKENKLYDKEIDLIVDQIKEQQELINKINILA